MDSANPDQAKTDRVQSRVRRHQRSQGSRDASWRHGDGRTLCDSGMPINQLLVVPVASYEARTHLG
jgi:hypothetical protein